MLLFNREVQTVGNPEQIMPLVQSFVNIANEAGVTLNVWSGSNGYVPGTLSFSGVYESVSEMSAGSAKINASKKWWETISKFREYVVTTKPDSVYNYVRGGAKGVVVPNGTIVQQNTFQMSSGSNFIETLTWMNELIDAAPNDELRDALNVLVSVMTEMEGVDENDPEAMSKVMEIIMDPKVTEAGEVIEKYSTDVCGITDETTVDAGTTP